eukprot:TRINITY_DN184_c1_g1_i2.p1 TRINITY_DN184_c1_g1~~TRINITY_DN184_c1_g1_i2.p1  ORF type:complete len:736 (-),score=333.49 TRINITY_DN184_c1_g1_i2:391-2598(-)
MFFLFLFFQDDDTFEDNSHDNIEDTKSGDETISNISNDINTINNENTDTTTTTITTVPVDNEEKKRNVMIDPLTGEEIILGGDESAEDELQEAIVHQPIVDVESSLLESPEKSITINIINDDNNGDNDKNDDYDDDEITNMPDVLKTIISHDEITLDDEDSEDDDDLSEDDKIDDVEAAHIADGIEDISQIVFNFNDEPGERDEFLKRVDSDIEMNAAQQLLVKKEEIYSPAVSFIDGEDDDSHLTGNSIPDKGNFTALKANTISDIDLSSDKFNGSNENDDDDDVMDNDILKAIARGMDDSERRSSMPVNHLMVNKDIQNAKDSSRVRSNSYSEKVKDRLSKRVSFSQVVEARFFVKNEAADGESPKAEEPIRKDEDDGIVIPAEKMEDFPVPELATDKAAKREEKETVEREKRKKHKKHREDREGSPRKKRRHKHRHSSSSRRRSKESMDGELHRAESTDNMGDDLDRSDDLRSSSIDDESEEHQSRHKRHSSRKVTSPSRRRHKHKKSSSSSGSSSLQLSSPASALDFGSDDIDKEESETNGLPKTQSDNSMMAIPESSNSDDLSFEVSEDIHDDEQTTETNPPPPSTPLPIKEEEEKVEKIPEITKDEEEIIVEEEKKEEPTVDPKKVVISSYLMKQDGTKRFGRKKWKKRWIVVTGESISYFNSSNDSSPQKTIPFTDLDRSCPVTSLDKKQASGKEYAFAVRTEDRDYIFQADSQENMKSYIEAISSHK